MIQNKLISIIVLLLVFTKLLMAQSLRAEEHDVSEFLVISGANYSVDWSTNVIKTNIHIVWEPNALEQYIFPKESFILAQDNFPYIFSKISERIFVDEQNTLIDFARDHSSYKFILSNILSDTVLTGQVPDKNLLGTSISFDTSLTPIIYKLIYPSFVSQNMPFLPSTLVDNTEYTSILFAVDKPTTLLQNNNEEIMYVPKIVPKAFDSSLRKLLYSPEYFKAEQSSTDRPFRYIFEEEYALAETGDKPLLIIPQYINNDIGGDIVLNLKDSKLFLSSPVIRRLINQGNVFFIIPKPTTEEIK